ncbi:MAG: nitroreductase family protein [Thermoleophilia bacterium]|nr:nitroreductase family protein [Thermoleophilia bacterium]
METWDALRARRDVRAFERRPIAPHDLERILDAGRRAPSAGNLQRWDFVLVTGPDALRSLAAVFPGAGHVGGSAAAVALVAPRDPDEWNRRSIAFDMGQAAMGIMLAAADLGIGSGHAVVRDHVSVRRTLALPDGHECHWIISLGYPGDRPLRPLRNPDRRAFEDVVHRERWEGGG